MMLSASGVASVSNENLIIQFKRNRSRIIPEAESRRLKINTRYIFRNMFQVKLTYLGGK